jgi:hypothetical protein
VILLNIRNLKEVIIDYIFEGGCISFFLISFFIFGLFEIIDNKILIILVLFFLCLLYLIRIINRAKKLVNLYYFDQEKKLDSIKRGCQIIDIISILILISFIASIFSTSFMNNSIIQIVLICIILFLFFASISISKDNILFRSLAILLTTIQGFFLFLIIIAGTIYAIDFFIYSVEGRPINFQFPPINDILIIGLNYELEKYVLLTVIVVFCTTILFSIYIFCVPPYQLNSLENSFKLINIIFVIIGIISFFYINISWNNINEYTQNLYNTIIKYKYYYNIPIDYINNYSKSDLTNLAYILILPYTLGLLISNFIIDKLQNFYKKKAEQSFNNLLEAIHNTDLKKQHIEFLKYDYYDGDKNLINLIKHLSNS